MALLDLYTGPWTSTEAAHLARRTTFGATPPQLSAMITQGVSAAVDAIVDYPAIDQALENALSALPDTEQNLKIKDPINANDLEGWWLFRFAHSTYPLQQQFALFLHDHFVSEYTKTSANVSNRSNDGNDGSITDQSCNLGENGLPPDPIRKRRIVMRLLRDQHNLFLTKGHGDFRQMLIEITRDPCMLIYLDNRLNIKGRPQENYAREVMELFSMGVGNYSEEDVRNVARAFTGETIRNSCSDSWAYNYYYNSKRHDTGTDKRVFGQLLPAEQTVGSNTLQVIDHILSRISGANISPAHSIYPATAIYISWKVINWFANQTTAIDDPVVAELADFFYNSTDGGGYRYNVREALRKLFKSQYFYDASHRFNMIKHPIDYVATAWRNLGLDEPNFAATASYNVRDMGMRLFEPPTVEGWHHGHAWINSSNLIARYNYANRLSSTTILSDAQIDALALPNDIAIRDYLAQRLLLDSLTNDEHAVFQAMFNKIRRSTSGITAHRRCFRAALHLTMTMPRYQLK